MSSRPSKHQFVRSLGVHFSLRFHMSLIVLATTGSGVWINRVLFQWGLTPLWIRCGLAVAATYFVFLALVRLWIAIMSHLYGKKRGPSDVLDVLDFLPDSLGSTAPVFSGKGGGFAGGGASASMDGRPGKISASKSGGTNISWDLDAAGVLLLIAFIALVASFIVAGGYLVWEAPVILAETLFEFSMASILIKKLKKTQVNSWLGHLGKLTWKPFLAVMLVTLIFCGLVHHFRPNAHRLSDLWTRVSPR